MSNKHEIHVNISEVKIGRSNDILKATLGSCVGIGFLWKEKGLFGLAHCLLPESQGTSFMIGAKYVTQAIPSLMALMKIDICESRKIEVVLTGGGNMMAQLSCQNQNNIGIQNIVSARKNLKAQGFNIKREDVGGIEGRQIFIDCTTGDIEIFKLPALSI